MRIFEGYQHGVNLGGWLSQCGQPDPQHISSFIREDDIKAIAGMGLDHVRLPVDWFFLETPGGTPLDIGLRAIDACVAWCGKAGIRLLLDLHKTFGYSFDPMDQHADRLRFFQDESLQERFCALWQRLAERYGGCSGVAFDLLNEVVEPEAAQEWNRILRTVIGVIRETAPDTWLVVGGTRYNNVRSVPELDVRLDERIVYNFHCYDPLVFTHQGAYWVQDMPEDFRLDYPGSLDAYVQATRMLNRDLAMEEGMDCLGPAFFESIFAPALAHAAKSNVPLYCGEYGVIDRADPEASLRWLRDISSVFSRHGIGRALWCYRKMDFGLVDAHYDSIRARMLPLL